MCCFWEGYGAQSLLEQGRVPGVPSGKGRGRPPSGRGHRLDRTGALAEVFFCRESGSAEKIFLYLFIHIY